MCGFVNCPLTLQHSIDIGPDGNLYTFLQDHDGFYFLAKFRYSNGNLEPVPLTSETAEIRDGLFVPVNFNQNPLNQNPRISVDSSGFIHVLSFESSSNDTTISKYTNTGSFVNSFEFERNATSAQDTSPEIDFDVDQNSIIYVTEGFSCNKN